MTARRWLWAIVAASLALRVGYVVSQYRDQAQRPQHYWDPEGYDEMGQRWLATGSFLDGQGRPMTEREPFYPLVLAAAHAAFGPSYVVAVALNLVFAAACCWLVYLLTLKLFADAAAALWAAAFAAIYPEWIYWSVFAYREPLITLLSLAWLLLWASARGFPRPAPFAAMGLAYGALCLTRSPMIPMGPAFALLAAWTLKPRLWKSTVAVFLACAAFVNGVWIARNYKVTGRIVAGASMGGLVMYMGLVKDYDKPEEALERNVHDVDSPVKRRVQALGGTGPAADAEYYRASKEIFWNEPRRFWSAFARKVLKLWRPFPYRGWSYDHRYELLKWIGLLSNVPLMLLAAAGAVIAWRRGAGIGFLLALPAVMTLVYGMFWAVTRYRSPLMISVFPLAALAWSVLLEKLGGRSRSMRRAPAPAAILLLLALAGGARAQRCESVPELGQLLMPGLPLDAALHDEYKKTVAELDIGCSYVKNGTLQSLTREEVEPFLDALKRSNPRSALLLAVDQEGGEGRQPLGEKHGFQKLPSLADLGKQAKDDPKIARAFGELLGRELKGVGIDWVFAPVVDVATQENEVIKKRGRSLGDDPALVRDLSREIIKGVQRQRVLATAKHYPGHGAATQDSHLLLATVDADWRGLWNADLLPFRGAIKAGVRAVMVGHIQIKGENGPASFSERLIERGLRKELGFRGLVVTDELIMGGALLHAGGPEEERPQRAALAAILAGNDVVVMGGASLPQVRAIYAYLCDAAARDPRAKSRFEEAAARVAEAKEWAAGK